MSAGDQVLEVTCRTYCSDEVKPLAGDDDVRPRRASVAEITWRVSGAQVLPRDVETRAAQNAIEVTVYSDGFSRRRFASLFSVREGQTFRMEGNQDMNTRIPGLDRLTILNVRPVRAGNPADSTFDGPSNKAAAEIEGLEPGLNYFWRIATAAGDRKMTSEVVMCQAPTCPVDLQPAGRP
jgi:hypothetical protein